MNNLEEKAKNNEYRDPIIQLPPPNIASKLLKTSAHLLLAPATQVIRL